MHRLLIAAFALFAVLGTASAFSGFAPYDKAKFEQAVESGAPVIAMVHADWCSTCRQQEKVLNDMLKEPGFAKVQAVRIDYDSEKDFQKAHKITTRATLLVFKGGKETARVVFNADPVTLKEAIKTAL